jgi:hypothetical protein
MADDPLTAALGERRALLKAAASPDTTSVSRVTVEFRLGLAIGAAHAFDAALKAALKFHQRVPLYGNASTEGEPGACSHDPGSPLHFEDPDEPGEWLCEGKPEGAACSGCPGSPDGEYADWPCPEYEAILAALAGEEAGNGN